MEKSIGIQGQATRGGSAASVISRRALTWYWVFTLWIALESLWAGVTDILRAPPLFGILLHLGYPPHFGTMLGVWKLLGAGALLVPRYPLLKEWAYAGMFFDFSAAVVAHASAGDGVLWYIGPILSIGALVALWCLRPLSRRVPGT
jgi:DoxX-like family